MFLKKYLQTLLLLFVLSTPALAQQKSWLTKYRYSTYISAYSNRKGLKCPINFSSEYPLHGIGVKLGDPAALTYKFYPNENIAFVLDFGRSASTLYTRYYRGKFDEYTDLITVDDNEELSYLSHESRADLFTEFKVLYSIDASAIANGLRIYSGIGWQWRFTGLTYNYVITDATLVNQFRSLDVNRNTSGPVLSLGFEYAYFDMPISAFMEIQLYYDTVIDPGWIRPQGGIGIRYIF
ncbi:MAG TPA: hypothetical protein PKC24_01045 [Cyclobacteriaceae bacterium]|nr:hypothetical protein [Cyclobacteriaceae bacterium]